MLLKDFVRGFCILGLLFGASHAAYAGWLETPDSLQLQHVGDELRINGTPMIIRAFFIKSEKEALLKQVEENWTRGDSQGLVTRSKAGEWTVLNQSIGKEHRSFQVRDIGPAQLEGYVSLTSPERRREPRVAVMLPSDMTPVSIIDSNDGGRISQQVIAVSHRSVAATASALSSALKAGGWKQHATRQEKAARMLSANKGVKELDAMLQPQKAGTLIMLNTVDQPDKTP